MLINPISARTSKPQLRKCNTQKVNFTGDKLKFMPESEVRSKLVDKYKNSTKLDPKLRKQIYEELLVERCGWETPKKPVSSKDIKEKLLMGGLTIASGGMLAIMSALQNGAAREEADRLADEVLAIISYITGKEIEEEKIPEYNTQYPDIHDSITDTIYSP